MHFNSRVYLPKPLEEQQEIALQHLKARLLASVDSYIEQHQCDQYANLTPAERSGLKSLKRRSENREVVIYQTDKSGRFSIDTIENYIQSCQPHVAQDARITEEEYAKLKSQMNTHSTVWVRILQAGMSIEQMKRKKDGMVVSDCDFAPLYCLRPGHRTSYETFVWCYNSV